MIDLNSYRAIIFDLDGTLVDSSIAITEVTRRWCEKHQLDLNHVLTVCHGSRFVDQVPHLAPELDAKREAAELDAQEGMTATGIVEIPGARELLYQLTRSGVNWGIATSGIHPVATLRLNTAKLPIPKVFVTGEQVSRGKPDPEHFVTTATYLQQIPEHCLVFEDSNNGVQGALQAGCDVVVIGNQVTLDHPRIRARFDNYWPLLKQLGIKNSKKVEEAS